ncbi:MAG: ATP-binding cassette domain-containing protein [Thermodesulfobacteriota bacterium]
MNLELRKISKNFGSLQALTEVDLTAEPGSIHGIIGENGAGKSTLMKILTGFFSKSGGDIFLDGENVVISSPRQAQEHRIGMLYQEPLDFPPMTILENFSLGLSEQSTSLEDDFNALAEKFSFHLEPSRRVADLTMGERQQLEMLRLIYSRVRLLILDEPTTGISPSQKKILFQVLKSLTKDGVTILLVSHKLEEIQQLCSKSTVIRHGRVTLTSTAPYDLSELLAAMFGETPELPAKENPRAKGAPALSMKGVSGLGERLGVDRLNLEVLAGEVIGLAGLDGAGQSTLLRLAAGLSRPSEGSISLFGELLPDTKSGYLEAQKHGAVFLPADRLTESLFPGLDLSAHFNLRKKSDSFWISHNQGRQLAEQGIDDFSIKGAPDSDVASLSGGNMQRLLLALMDRTSRLVLLENPTRGLDVRSARSIWHFLRHELDEEAVIIFSSPELDEIFLYSDRVLVFHDGRIVLDGPTAELSQDSIAQAMTGLSGDQQDGQGLYGNVT